MDMEATQMVGMAATQVAGQVINAKAGYLTNGLNQTFPILMDRYFGTNCGSQPSS